MDTSAPTTPPLTDVLEQLQRKALEALSEMLDCATTLKERLQVIATIGRFKPHRTVAGRRGAEAPIGAPAVAKAHESALDPVSGPAHKIETESRAPLRRATESQLARLKGAPGGAAPHESNLGVHQVPTITNLHPSFGHAPSPKLKPSAETG